MLVELPLDLGVYIVVVGVDIVVGVGVFLGDIIAQPGLDVLVAVGLAGEAGAVIRGIRAAERLWQGGGPDMSGPYGAILGKGGSLCITRSPPK